MTAVNLAFKITNWCNMHCAHCCERSHNQRSFDIMPIEWIEKYVPQYKDMGKKSLDYVVFTGGETMLPYLCGQDNYIPTVANICAQNNKSACFKTNAKWNAAQAAHILADLADVAHEQDRQIALDISIDEYHDNLNSAAHVVNLIMDSQYMIDAIPVTLVGLNTAASQYKYQEFVNVLTSRKMHVGAMDSNGVFSISKGSNFNVMFYDVGQLCRLGRAADNNLTDVLATDTIKRDVMGDCLEITNSGIARLNYGPQTEIKNKTLGKIYNDLLMNKR